MLTMQFYAEINQIYEKISKVMNSIRVHNLILP